MRLKTLYLDHFRNLEATELNIGPGFNLFVGRNAQGKSSLLEAVYYLGLGRSQRTGREEELIAFTESSAAVAGKFSYAGSEFTLGVSWEKSPGNALRKTIHFNRNPLRRLSDFLEKAPMVMLGGDDMELVRGVPENRRRLLDLLCCRLYPPNVETLRRYRKVLEARNKWLKLPPKQQDPGLGEVYMEKLSHLGSKIINRRLQAMDLLRPLHGRLYSRVFGGEAPDLRYRTSIKNIIDKSVESMIQVFRQNLSRVREGEFRRKHTLVGPHRDDLYFKYCGKSMRNFSSSGEIRRAAVVLKLAEVEVIYEKTGRQPIVLVDDCLNEFDREHIEKFFNFLIGKRQVFYTSTGARPYFEKITGISTYLVEKGGITPCGLSSLKAL